MHPSLFTVPPFVLLGREIGPFTLHTYGVLLACAFLAALWAVSRQARRDGLDPVVVGDGAFWVLLAGLVGAKVLLLVVEWDYYSRNPQELLYIFRSAGVFYGGLLLAIPAAFLYARRHHLPPWRTADVLAPGVALGQAIGRWGCLAAGCCFGRPTDLPWAITFTSREAERQGTPLHVPLHPTQLYESAATLVIFAILLFVARRKRFHGQVMAVYVGLYATARFTIEHFRDDRRGSLFQGAVSTSQFVAVVMVLALTLVVPWLMRNQKVDAAASTPDPAPAA